MKKIALKVVRALPFVFAGLMIASSVFASTAWAPTGGPTNLDEFVQNALNIAVILAALVAVVFLIVNGISYITSAGDTQKTEEAQKGIIAALIGLVVVGIAYLLVRFVVLRVLRFGELGGLDQ